MVAGGTSAIMSVLLNEENSASVKACLAEDDLCVSAGTYSELPVAATGRSRRIDFRDEIRNRSAGRCCCPCGANCVCELGQAETPRIPQFRRLFRIRSGETKRHTSSFRGKRFFENRHGSSSGNGTCQQRLKQIENESRGSLLQYALHPLKKWREGLFSS